MSQKVKKIVATILMVIPALILVFSGIMKVTRQPMMVEGLSKVGFAPYIVMVGAFELLFTVLFLVPKTRKVGFLFVTSYLGGAAAIEIAEGRAPVAFVFTALAWIGMYLYDKTVFTGKPAIQ